MLRLPPFEYHRPGTVEEALRLLASLGGAAMPVAGGTDVIPNMKHRLHEPAHLVSLRGIEALKGIRHGDAGLVIGAGETLADIAAHPLVAAHAPALAAAAGQVAGPQLRNAGTVGGNLCLDTRCTYYNQTPFWREALGFCLKKDGDTCHVTKAGRKCVAAHSADTPPVLWALGASVVLTSVDGSRTVPVEDFFVADGIRNTVREAGEILTEVRVPAQPAGTRMAFRKLRQRAAIDFPLLNTAVVARLDGDGTLRALRIVVSALGSRPRELSGLDAFLGEPLDDQAVDGIAGLGQQQCRPLTNLIVDPEWRRAMVPVEVRRALRAISGSATSGSR